MGTNLSVYETFDPVPVLCSFRLERIHSKVYHISLFTNIRFFREIIKESNLINSGRFFALLYPFYGVRDTELNILNLIHVYI